MTNNEKKSGDESFDSSALLSREYVVQLQIGCWIADWEGDPGRTLKLGNAKRFSTQHKAYIALEQARTYRPFKEALVNKIK